MGRVRFEIEADADDLAIALAVMTQIGSPMEFHGSGREEPAKDVPNERAPTTTPPEPPADFHIELRDMPPSAPGATREGGATFENDATKAAIAQALGTSTTYPLLQMVSMLLEEAFSGSFVPLPMADGSLGIRRGQGRPHPTYVTVQETGADTWSIVETLPDDIPAWIIASRSACPRPNALEWVRVRKPPPQVVKVGTATEDGTAGRVG